MAIFFDRRVFSEKNTRKTPFFCWKKFARPVWINHIMGRLFNPHQWQNILSPDYDSLRQIFHLINGAFGVFP